MTIFITLLVVASAAVCALVPWVLANRRDRPPIDPRIRHADFNGPAVLEVFGHQRHVGWIRCDGDRIDVLTIDGEALQVAAAARFRLTPMTWAELVLETLRERSRREERVSEYQDDIKDLRADVDAMYDRLEALRRSLSTIRDKATENDYPAAAEMASKAIAADDTAMGLDEECPF